MRKASFIFNVIAIVLNVIISLALIVVTLIYFFMYKHPAFFLVLLGLVFPIISTVVGITTIKSIENDEKIIKLGIFDILLVSPLGGIFYLVSEGNNPADIVNSPDIHTSMYNIGEKVRIVITKEEIIVSPGKTIPESAMCKATKYFPAIDKYLIEYKQLEEPFLTIVAVVEADKLK